MKRRTTLLPQSAIAAALALVLAACSLQDEVAPAAAPAQVAPEPECFVIPRYPPGSSFTWFIGSSDSVSCTLPTYNPNNGQEIIYLRDNSLRRANLRTGQQQPLATPKKLLNTEVSWSKWGWLVFGDAVIWKMKANGDSLTRLTGMAGSYVYSPVWSPDGSRVAYYCQSCGPQNTRGLAIISGKTGQRLQFIPGVEFYYTEPRLAWSPDGQKLAFVAEETTTTSPSLCTLDLASQVLTPIDTVALNANGVARKNSWTSSVVWLPNGHEILWVDHYLGLRLTNTNTRAHRVVRANCPGGSRNVSSVALAPDGRELLVGLTDWTFSGIVKSAAENLETMDLVTGQRTSVVELH